MGQGATGAPERPGPRDSPEVRGLEVDLATDADDLALQALLTTSTLPGNIAIALRRSPSFFTAGPVFGSPYQVVAVRERASGRIVAMAERSERRLFVGGSPSRVGYLSGARIAPGFRGGTILSRGFAFLEELHQRGGVPFYITTISTANSTAIDVLTRGRAGLPKYHPLGTYHTMAIPVHRQTAPLADPRRPPRTRTRTQPGHTQPEGVTIEAMQSDDTAQVADFLARVGSRRQFFPVLEAADLEGRTGVLRGMTAEDVLVARRSGRIVGTLARWDQREFRQSVVTGYSGLTWLMRPLYNAIAWIRGRPRLPAAGHQVESVYLGLAAVEDDDAEVMECLVRRHLEAEWRRGTAYITLGLHEDDPLAPVVDRFFPIRIDSLLFAVTFDQEGSLPPDLESRIPYVDIGTL